MLNNVPPITIIIPTLNEQGFIGGCLKSILDGNYPIEQLEVLVIDGGSTDRTREEVNAISHCHPQIKLLHNERKIVPAAMNIGTTAAQNDILVWLGAHAVYHCDYLVNSVKVLLEEKCASSGGVIRPIAKSYVGQAIAAVTSSKFGIGNAKYRYADKRQSVDTVFGGCWQKADIVKIGGFNEKWIRNQDSELNIRLREQIGEIILDPSIRCDYYCRESISSLAKQYYSYGKWRFQTSKLHPSSISLRQLAPIFLFLGLTASFVLLAFSNSIGFILPSIYLVFTLLAALIISVKQKRPGYFALVPLVLATLHLAWAYGFISASIINLSPISNKNTA